jgi:hypothetical protein
MTSTYIEAFVGSLLPYPGRAEEGSAVDVAVRSFTHRGPLIILTLVEDCPPMVIEALTVMLKLEPDVAREIVVRLGGVIDRLESGSLLPQDYEEDISS